jgi:hypothetical protein
MFNSAEVVKLLLTDPRVDPSFNENEPIYNASSNGHLSIVKMLVNDTRVNPQRGLVIAKKNGYDAVVNFLESLPVQATH